MQVRKFEAQTMKEVLEMVKVDMGPEAIVLSIRDNIKSFGLLGEDSVEVTAAISNNISQKKKNTKEESDEGNSQGEINNLKQQVSRLKNVIYQFKKEPQGFVTPHPGAKFGLSYDLSNTYQKLNKVGLDKEFIAKILLQAQKSLTPVQLKKETLIDAWAARYIMGSTRVVEELANEKVHVFVGSSGQGKTSCLIKMASYLIIKEKKKVAIISGDTDKVGAVDQLKIYAQILNAPFGILRGKVNWSQILEQLKSVDYILLDTPGFKLKELEEISRLKKMLPPQGVSSRVHYVQSAITKDQDAFEMARRYRMTDFDDVIFNRVDESIQHGLLYNFQQKFQVPLHSFGVGCNIPEDYEIATRERVLDLIFKISN